LERLGTARSVAPRPRIPRHKTQHRDDRLLPTVTDLDGWNSKRLAIGRTSANPLESQRPRPFAGSQTAARAQHFTRSSDAWRFVPGDQIDLVRVAAPALVPSTRATGDLGQIGGYCFLRCQRLCLGRLDRGSPPLPVISGKQRPASSSTGTRSCRLPHCPAASLLGGRDVRASPEQWAPYRDLVRSVVEEVGNTPTIVLGACTPES
jgi:hypothetical protein